MEIEVRRGMLKDVPDIADLRMLLLEGIAKKTLADSFKVGIQNYLARNIDDDSLVCYVAFDSECDKVVATAIMCVYNVIPKLNNPSGKTGYVFSVYTRSEYRKMGIATKLLQKIIESAKEIGVEQIYLNAEENAVNLYKKQFFKDVPREMMLNLGPVV